MVKTLLSAVGLLGSLGLVSSVATVGAQGAAAESASEPSTRAVLDKYCVTCRNERLRRGDLALDTVDPATVAPHTDVWEKVVRKLNAGVMPPQGSPRPDNGVTSALVASLGRALDQAAQANPNPGRVAVHRLNCPEYRNVITNLQLTMMDRFGMPMEKFGDSNGDLALVSL